MHANGCSERDAINNNYTAQQSVCATMITRTPPKNVIFPFARLCSHSESRTLVGAHGLFPRAAI